MQIKTDVETQGDFIRFLIKEIEHAAFTDIVDVVPFVKWLDDELSYLVNFFFSYHFKFISLSNMRNCICLVNQFDDLKFFQVDERAVLKHFEWPEQKADALREAAFGYCDLKKLESEASSFRDNPRQPCGTALKKMQALFEKYEFALLLLLLLLKL